jgi:SNF2 family DNA or RNA helicase
MQVKLLAGKVMIPATITKEGSRLYISCPYNKDLIEEIKSMAGARWHGFDGDKRWSVSDTARNHFQLQYLQNPVGEKSPYHTYDMPLIDVDIKRPVFKHQVEMIRHAVTRRRSILAAEMGTGKTLVAIETMEWALTNEGRRKWLWVGPKSALVSVRLEMEKWKCKVIPTFVTYESLYKMRDHYDGIVFDECSRLKTPTTRRTKAAKDLADKARETNGFILMLSGTPTPKAPSDWWSICEVCCPGFIKEGSLEKFRSKLAIIENVQGAGSFPQLIAWKDDPNKCNLCGLPREAETHNEEISMFGQTSYSHKFEPSVNEVERLGKRLAGLVLVKYKKDCLDLPELFYRKIELAPSKQILHIASLIKEKAARASTALVMLRELSDGFQYEDIVVDSEVCTLCNGTKQILAPVYHEGVTESEIQAGTAKFDMCNIVCTNCGGKGETDITTRKIKVFPTPKDDALIDLLEELEDVGRTIICAGFTGSIDKIVNLVESQGWSWIKIDGRGWTNNLGIKSPEDMVRQFQEGKDKIAIVMHPASGGMGLTLTASSTIIFYSNDFSWESRAQAISRIHRPGMTKAGTIIDLLHLPTDYKVLDNLQRKQSLMALTLDVIKGMI